ncbi:hypothetical protein ACJJTC_009689 [Scirpophaga incertulas]
MKMDTEIMVETLPLLGVCTLCLKEGVVKSMLISQKHNGVNVLYTDMLLKCYSIDISTYELGDAKLLICTDCISKLRDAFAFREQVESSIKVLAENCKKQCCKPEVEAIKHESDVSIDLDYDNIFDDDDNMALNEFKIKSEMIKDETRSKTRKTIKKKIKLIQVKKIDLSETESMLQSGLFPFKIRNNKCSDVFACSVCPEKSSSLDDIKSHVSQHNKSNISAAFRKMMFSNSHTFYKFSNSKLRCKICTTDVSNYDELKQHVENCGQLKYTRKWNKLPFKLEKDQLDCPVCNKTFLNYVSLNTHMNVHYPNYICENCGKAFASKARLRGHMRTHEVGYFPCRHCDAVFDRVTKRENHVSKEHKSGVRYACKRCNINLPSFYARQKHLAEVHDEELKRYKCKLCPQSYITPGHLSSHVRRDHLNERNHKCEKCDLAFYTKNALKMHMIKHDGERIHTCSVCQKSYQRKKTLREHMRIHTNDKRFVCPVCGRAFTQKCTLKGHLKVHERKVDGEDWAAQPLHSI